MSARCMARVVATGHTAMLLAAMSVPAWAEEAHGIRRLMDNNPREMSVDDVLTIYRAAY